MEGAGSQSEGRGLAALKGKAPKDFTYTSLSGTDYVEAIDDIGDFGAMDSALECVLLALSAPSQPLR